MAPVEQEHNRLENSFLKVWVGAGRFRRYEFNFFFSKIDEKLDRAASGLQGSWSNYLCILCHVSSPESAKEKLGEFSIIHTQKDTSTTATYLIDNPDKLSAAHMKNISLGVNAVPLVRADAKQKGIDATHANINLASILYKLLVREIASAHVWEQAQSVKPMLQHSGAVFDAHVKKNLAWHLT